MINTKRKRYVITLDLIVEKWKTHASEVSLTLLFEDTVLNVGEPTVEMFSEHFKNLFPKAVVQIGIGSAKVSMPIPLAQYPFHEDTVPTLENMEEAKPAWLDIIEFYAQKQHIHVCYTFGDLERFSAFVETKFKEPADFTHAHERTDVDKVKLRMDEADTNMARMSKLITDAVAVIGKQSELIIEMDRQLGALKSIVEERKRTDGNER